MNDTWWFAAREGDMGPFRTAEKARIELHKFIQEMQFLEQNKDNPKLEVIEPIKKNDFTLTPLELKVGKTQKEDNVPKNPSEWALE